MFPQCVFAVKGVTRPITCLRLLHSNFYAVFKELVMQWPRYFISVRSLFFKAILSEKEMRFILVFYPIKADCTLGYRSVNWNSHRILFIFSFDFTLTKLNNSLTKFRFICWIEKCRTTLTMDGTALLLLTFVALLMVNARMRTAASASSAYAAPVDDWHSLRLFAVGGPTVVATALAIRLLPHLLLQSNPIY